VLLEVEFIRLNPGLSWSTLRACCPVQCGGRRSEHVSGAENGAERAEIGWSEVERCAGVPENDGAGEDRGTGMGSRLSVNRPLTTRSNIKSNLMTDFITSAHCLQSALQSSLFVFTCLVTFSHPVQSYFLRSIPKVINPSHRKAKHKWLNGITQLSVALGVL